MLCCLKGAICHDAPGLGKQSCTFQHVPPTDFVHHQHCTDPDHLQCPVATLSCLVDVQAPERVPTHVTGRCDIAAGDKGGLAAANPARARGRSGCQAGRSAPIPESHPQLAEALQPVKPKGPLAGLLLLLLLMLLLLLLACASDQSARFLYGWSQPSAMAPLQIMAAAACL